MPETYTMDQLLSEEQAEQDYPLIRRLAGEVLHVGPWRHRYMGREPAWPICVKCKHVKVSYDNSTCPVPDPACGSKADIAERLKDRLSRGKDGPRLLREAIALIRSGTWRWFGFDPSPAARCVCFLAVLLPERITP
jgi:hypothetical protein